MQKAKPLPAINSCDDCGACCRTQVMPPFVHLDEDEEWRQFKDEQPKLASEIEAEIDRKRRENDWPDEAPCLWYDTETKRCLNYEHRPSICSDFEISSEACLGWRKQFDIPEGVANA